MKLKKPGISHSKTYKKSAYLAVFKTMEKISEYYKKGKIKDGWRKTYEFIDPILTLDIRKLLNIKHEDILIEFRNFLFVQGMPNITGDYRTIYGDNMSPEMLQIAWVSNGLYAFPNGFYVDFACISSVDKENGMRIIIRPRSFQKIFTLLPQEIDAMKNENMRLHADLKSKIAHLSILKEQPCSYTNQLIDYGYIITDSCTLKDFLKLKKDDVLLSTLSDEEIIYNFRKYIDETGIYIFKNGIKFIPQTKIVYTNLKMAYRFETSIKIEPVKEGELDVPEHNDN